MSVAVGKSKSLYSNLLSVDSARDVLTRETRSSANVDGWRDASQIRTVTFERACNRGMTFKDTRSHHNCCYYIGRIQVSLSGSGRLLQHI